MSKTLWPRLALASACALLAGGCLVDSRCASDEDCVGNETCDQQSGACRVECESDTDCLVNGAAVGKQCLNYRCDFPYGLERREAPLFCLEVVNPGSGMAGNELCLDQLKGKVVLIYFALLA